MQAAAFIDLHGKTWLYLSRSALNSVIDGPRDTVEHWVDLIEKMHTIEQSPRH
ncbi:hypothetical protein U1872_18350 [Sphingomonas sp. RB3P16]|uniref:hypothetical protein n=1 Tax=Parasphingomonas frigoris TaxID=3096163 RepID=UPI002FCAC4D8